MTKIFKFGELWFDGRSIIRVVGAETRSLNLGRHEPEFLELLLKRKQSGAGPIGSKDVLQSIPDIPSDTRVRNLQSALWKKIADRFGDDCRKYFGSFEILI